MREHNERAWLAWNTARLMHFHHKPQSMPRLSTLLMREGPALRQTAEQQLQIVTAMYAAFNAVGRKAKS